MTEKQHARTRFAKIGSFSAYKRLEPLVIAKYNHTKLTPLNAFVSNSPTNLLTKVVVWLLKEYNHSAERINSTGQFVDNRETFTDIVGRNRTIGSTGWRKSGATPGIADVMSTIYGIRVGWEIKYGKDRMRESQKKFRDYLVAAGGYYFIIRNLDDFFKEYDI